MQTVKQVRGRGIVLMMIGGLLSGGMIYLLLLVTSIMHPEISKTTSRFTGTRSDAAFLLGILGTLLVFAIAGFITGIWQVVTGRVNRVFTITMLAVGILLATLALIFYFKS